MNARLHDLDLVVFNDPQVPKGPVLSMCWPLLATVLNYLGRYVHHVAVSNSRILAIDDGAFRFQESGHTEWKTFTVAATEFIRRFLMHVLPAGVHKVGYYGLWAPSNRRLLRQVQLLLAADDANTRVAGRVDLCVSAA